MDEYIKRNNVISAVCFGCNQEFSDAPCEPDACAIRQSIMTLHTADVVAKSESEFDSIPVEVAQVLKDKAVEKAKAEVAREIFEEIEDIIQDRKNEEIKRQGDNKMMSPFTYSFGVLEIIEHQYAELKKKYTGGKNEL